MVLETEPQPFFDWLPDALAAWLAVCAVLVLAVVAVVAAARLIPRAMGRAEHSIALRMR